MEEKAQMEDLVDDDLRKLLQQELNESKQRREKIRKPKEPEPEEKSEEEIQKELEDFESVDELDEAEEFDLSEIEAEHPSQYTSDKEPEIDKTEPSAPEAEEQDEEIPQEKVKPEKQKEQKKRRKLTPFAIIGLTAAALVLLSAIGFGIYSAFFANQGDTDIVAADSLKKSTADVTDETDNKTQDEKYAKGKTPAADKEDVKPADKEDVKPADKEEVQKAEASVKEKEQDITSAEKPAVSEKSLPAPKKKAQAAPKKVIKPKPSGGPAKEKKQKKLLYSEAEITDTKDSKPSLKHTEHLYIVQVYASPSEDDAEMWLQRLRNKNVDNPFISTQKIRDKIWYRVRFGSFKTKEEAQNAAIKLGFSQSWVDRVR